MAFGTSVLIINRGICCTDLIKPDFILLTQVDGVAVVH